MRGTLQRRPQRHVTAGIIPAYAGNTGHTQRKICTLGDHPRVCGEHFPENTVLLIPAGSSPRMRGTQ